jgi:homocitrate synthase NifV
MTRESRHPKRPVLLRDSTLREAMDTPGVWFDAGARRRVAELLQQIGVQEVEVVAPARLADDLEAIRPLRDAGVELRLTGLIYTTSPDFDDEVERAAELLDRLDLLVPLSTRRPPASRPEKVSLMLASLERALQAFPAVGVGFPHASQTEEDFVIDIAKQADGAGAEWIIFYDTNGSAQPFGVHQIIKRLVSELEAGLIFHGHDDLGLATANSLAAVLSGAVGLDVTINGLGDRAGNASLEQLAVLLEREGFDTGIDLSQLRFASELVAEESGIPVSGLAPVVGDFAFEHKSPSHLAEPSEFEAFEPELVGGERRLQDAIAGTSEPEEPED